MAVILGRKGGGGGGGGGAPTGAAGGSLGGTYPNPTLSVAKQAELDGKIAKAIVDAKGDLIAATAADTVARVAVGATNGMHLEAQSGQAAGIQWVLPPGYQFDYTELSTGFVTVAATTAAGATTIITGGSVAYDGSTRIRVELFAPAGFMATAGNSLYATLWDGSTDLGTVTELFSGSTVSGQIYGVRYLTPSAGSHAYHFKAYKGGGAGTFVIENGAGGAGTLVPAFIRVSKA